MKKRIFLMVIISLFVALSGCGSNNEKQKTQSISAEKTNSVEMTESEYKASCSTYDYKEISRYPKKYVGSPACFYGEVQQVLEKGNDVQLLVSVTYDGYFWDDSIMVWYTRKDVEEPRILEDDLIILWGDLDELYSYESVLGAEITIPSVQAHYVELTDESSIESNTQENSGVHTNDASLSSSSSNTPSLNSFTESELLSSIENQLGHTVDDHIYIDMDHDNHCELIASYYDNDGYLHHWFCSYDGSKCTELNLTDYGLPYFSYETIEFENETHVVINTVADGSLGYFTIISYENGSLYALCENNYGNVHQVNNEIIVEVDGYDSIYDPSMGFCVGHNVKQTYLYYNGESYHEYPLIYISEEEFLTLENAYSFYPAFGVGENCNMEWDFYSRENGYKYIQISIEDTVSGEISYFYYTYRCQGNTVVDYWENEGQLSTYLTDVDDHA